MQLPVTRRVRRIREGSIGPWALLGFGAGIAAGFLLGEVLGRGTTRRAVQRVKELAGKTGKAAVRTARSLRAATIRAVLEAEPELSQTAFHLVPTGTDAFELRGWVQSRAWRTRAHRLAQAASGSYPVVNRLLVRGEDDANDDQLDPEPRSA